VVTAQDGAPTASVRWISPRGTHGLPDLGRPLSRRTRRAADTPWGLAETVLASRGLSNSIVVAPTLVVATLCLRHGVDGLIANVPSLAVIWSAVYGLVRLGRSWRGVRPRSHAPCRTNLPAISWQRPLPKHDGPEHA
jgi:hypothetical protein